MFLLTSIGLLFNIPNHAYYICVFLKKPKVHTLVCYAVKFFRREKIERINA